MIKVHIYAAQRILFKGTDNLLIGSIEEMDQDFGPELTYSLRVY